MFALALGFCGYSDSFDKDVITPGLDRPSCKWAAHCTPYGHLDSPCACRASVANTQLTIHAIFDPTLLTHLDPTYPGKWPLDSLTYPYPSILTQWTLYPYQSGFP